MSGKPSWPSTPARPAPAQARRRAADPGRGARRRRGALRALLAEPARPGALLRRRRRSVLQDRAARRRLDARPAAGPARRGRPAAALPGHSRHPGASSPGPSRTAARVLVMRRLDAQPLNQLEIGWRRLGGVLLALARAGRAPRLARRQPRRSAAREHPARPRRPDPPDRLRPGELGRPSRLPRAQPARAAAGARAGQQQPVGAAARAHPGEPAAGGAAPAQTRRAAGRAPAAALPPLPPDAGPALRALHAAWRLAAAAGASAPGAALAYHQLEWQGLRLPGERPWAERWRSLRADHALSRAARARARLQSRPALDLPAQGSRRRARRSRSTATRRSSRRPRRRPPPSGVAPTFLELDFDRDPDWEARLAAFRPDVVFALSLLHWVRDRARLLAFLGRCDEVIYEGHDSARTEWRRLRARGLRRRSRWSPPASAAARSCTAGAGRRAEPRRRPRAPVARARAHRNHLHPRSRQCSGHACLLNR